MVYFDNSATTQVCPAAITAVMEAMNNSYGNPSSGHALGLAAKRSLDRARAQVASAMGAAPAEITFTSGGTEADNWAIMSGALKFRQGKHILSTAIEHDAVLNTLKHMETLGYDVEFLSPDADGYISVEKFEEAIRPDTCLVSAMLVNNEVGSVLPIAQIAAAIKRKKSHALLHTDAVQGFLKVPFTVKSLGADLISISSHKLHGPKGTGALWIRSGLHLRPIIWGGGQENGLRSGTEAMPSIMGFGAAAEAGKISMDRDIAVMREVRETIVHGLSGESMIIGSGAAPHILSLSLPGYRSEVLLNFLDSRGICVSRGSACTKGRRSHVLTAMGLPIKVIDGAIRLSFSGENTVSEAEYFIKMLLAAKASLAASVR